MHVGSDARVNTATTTRPMIGIGHGFVREHWVCDCVCVLGSFSVIRDRRGESTDGQYWMNWDRGLYRGRQIVEIKETNNSIPIPKPSNNAA